jgi:murein DD-endopeptidase MepM/ murein hydrolase activator NlpD
VKATSYIRTGAFALALAAAVSAEAAPRADPVRLRPIPPVLAGEVDQLAAAAARAEARRAVFPVRGEFNWGQGGARFGASRGGRAHEGQDVFARTGTPLVAVRKGVVLETGDDGGRGNYVAVFSPVSRRTYVYLHMNEPSRAKRGQSVTAGRRLGSVGCTGSCSGDHLHFEIHRGRTLEGPAENPLPVLRRWAARSDARATLPPGAH